MQGLSLSVMFFPMRIIFVLTLIVLSLPAFARKLTLPYMGRNFTVVTPEKSSPGKKPLLVLLHGCKQNPNLILEGTGLEYAALKYDFVVMAPEQSVINNIDHCWNWFLDINQVRSSFNEMGQIIGAIEAMVATRKVDRERIYLAGMSAGGVMAHNLSVCYPDYFSAVAIHSGLAYKVAENVYEAQTVLTASQLKSPNYLGEAAFECSRDVSKKRLKQMILIHGNKDPRVDPYHMELISKTNEVMLDYRDDNNRNNSVKVIVKTSELKARNGYSVVRTVKTYPAMNFTEQSFLVKGMAHAWGGGKPVSANFDPKAPSSTDLILNFLQLK
jgi:poly(hydroxyalkanoate) depolymerase family esterase